MKKNIVLILSDDQGAWAMHCAGNEDLITPNLDRLSKMGARFTNFFCASPVCSPARASIVTGEMPSSHGVLDWLSGGNMNTKDYPYMKDHEHFQTEDHAIDYLEGHDTYVKHLSQAGYHCALSGKWHLGDSVHPKEGFEKWYTIGTGGCQYFHPDIVENGKFYHENRYVTDLITKKALEYLDEYMAKEEPYYLSVHYTAPHAPWGREQHKEEFLKLYDHCDFHATPDMTVHPDQITDCPVGDTSEHRRENLTGYYAAITAMDAGIGEILDKLEASGQLDHTLVIFTADNGMNMGHHGIWGKGNGTYPANMYDSSVKVPFLIYDPEYFTGGQIIHRMTGHCDLFPSLLDLVGIPYELNEKQFGRSMKLFAGQPELEEEEAVVICDEYGKVRMIRSAYYKFIKYYDTMKEIFYDLREDPDETTNRIGEPRYQAIIADLRERMTQFFEHYSDEKNSGIQYPVTGSGQLLRCYEKNAFDQTIHRYYGKQFQLPEQFFGGASADHGEKQEEQKEQKERDMAGMLDRISRSPLRPNTFRSVMKSETDLARFYEQLSEEGRFADLKEDRNGWSTAFKRLTCMIVTDFGGKTEEVVSEIPERLLRGLVYYGTLETTWKDRGPVRFHDSCFALPVCAVNLYYVMLPIMREIQKQSELWLQVYQVLCTLMLQAWTLPERGDETDQTPFSKKRFQDHVWWMGGNALAYRPVFQTALCFGDSRLLDVLGEVIKEASASKAADGEPAFWTEGICADGFGWGHGAQAYNHGYPTDSLREIFQIVKQFKHTSYEWVLKEMDWNNIISYINGISWSSYGTYIPPMMGRVCFARNGKQESTTEMMKGFCREILAEFAEYVRPEQLVKLKQAEEMDLCEIPDQKNEYHGTRYFFNNDTLISKNQDRYFYFNSASSRCKGVECAHEMADTRNFYIRDGSYILLTDPESFETVKGTYNPCHFPGTTERDLTEEEILAETNWNGYNSSHNFAGGLGDQDLGVAGFVYEKNETHYPDGAGIVRNAYTREMMGIKACKSVFVCGNLLVFLGAGIEDYHPEYGRHVITTVNNVRLLAGSFVDAAGKKMGELVSGTYDGQMRYIRNDGMLYGILPSSRNRLSVMAGGKRTHWAYLNFQNRQVPDEEIQVLELMIDHGEHPVDGGYAYWICTDPEKKPSELEQEFSVIQNTSKVQAVCFVDGTMMAVCYEPAKISWNDYTLQVSRPSVVMVKQSEPEHFSISFSDPCHNREIDSLTISLEDKQGRSSGFIHAELPIGVMRGSAGKVQIDL